MASTDSVVLGLWKEKLRRFITIFKILINLSENRMFSVGASPFNGLTESLYGGAAKRRAWMSAVKSGKVKRDSKGRFLPRSGKKRSSRRRYRSSSSDDVLITGERRGFTQSGVDQAAMNLSKLKRKWDYYKDFMSGDGDAPPVEMYPVARRILNNLDYLKRAQRMEYYPAYQIPTFQPWDQAKIISMASMNWATRKMGGREYDRQVALALASNGEDVPYDLKRKRVRWAQQVARAHMQDPPMAKYRGVFDMASNGPTWEEIYQQQYQTVKAEPKNL